MLRLKSLWFLGCGLVWSMGVAWGQAFQWEGLSQEAYFEQLVACQSTLKRHEWSKTLWPESNKSPKPDFAEVVSIKEIRQMVAASLHKQAVLERRFNVTVTQELLQNDLHRMARDTQDAAALAEIFALFGHDPVTIAHCVSRPHLVESKLRTGYESASDLHQETRELAHNELLDFKHLGALKAVHQGRQITVTYRLGALAAEATETASNAQLIGLNPDQFAEQRVQLNSSLGQLQEHRSHFSFTRLVNESNNHYTVQVLTWKKRALGDWLAEFGPVVDHEPAVVTGLSLPVIKDPVTVRVKAVMPDTWEDNFQVPYERLNHTAVWTGTEMIVWGGLIGGIELNTGGRYNPTTDSWTEMSTDGAPIARDEHTAVWTGSEMVVWGGRYLFNGYNYLRSGGVYDPSTDTWTATTTSGGPSRRSDHVSVWDGNDVLIWGGYDGATYFDTGYKYDPDTDSWGLITTTGAPSGRKSHTAVWTGDKMIVWGGNNLARLRSGGIYDPVMDQWQTTNDGDAPAWRNNHVAVWADDVMIVWGGADGPFEYNSGGMYDPDTDTWVATSLTNAPSERVRPVAVWTGSEMFLWGGSNAGAFNDGARFSPNTNSWSPITATNAPTARSNFTGIWTGTEVIVWGGVGSGAHNTGGRYHPGNNTWQATHVSDAPRARTFHSTVWTGMEMIIWGGENSPYLNDGAKYVPSTNTWTPITLVNAPTARSEHIAVWTGTYMIVWGGKNFDIAPSTYFNDGGRYRPLTDTWFFMSNVQNPSARYNHVGVWTGSEVVVWGGRGTVYENTGGRYDPVANSWSPTSIVGAPAARRSPSAIWTGDEMIVWGGTSFDGSSTFYDDGGRYDPDTDSWQTTSTTNAPSARLDHVVVWTGQEMIVWGGGPFGPGSMLQTGGRYDPMSDAWVATSTAAAPSPRKGHKAIWTGREMIVWGGNFSDGYQDYYNTGGRYDPGNNTWQATSLINAPIERIDHGMIWTGLKMIVWGGSSGSAPTSSTNSVGTYFPYDDLIYADDFED